MTYTSVNSYGLPIMVMDFLKWDGLTDVGDIPYRFVHFEQEFYYKIWPTFVKWQQITDLCEYISCAQSAAPKSGRIQSVYPS